MPLHMACNSACWVNGTRPRYHNIKAVAAIDGILEFTIGHAIVSRAVFSGLHQAVADEAPVAAASRLMSCRPASAQNAGFEGPVSPLFHVVSSTLTVGSSSSVTAGCRSLRA